MKYKTIIHLIIILISIPGFCFQNDKIDSDLLNEKIQTQLNTLYDETKDFAGATIGVVLPNNEKLSFAIGYADIDNKVKMKPSDLMLGGSTGKIFVSTSIMQLVERGIINLDDKIGMYLEKFNWFDQLQNYNNITIRHLLQHSSGISRYVFEEGFKVDIHKDPDRVWDPSELIKYVLNKKPLFEAGTNFAYSDTNYILLGIIIEEVSGNTMYDFINENIIKPFNLSGMSPQVNRKVKGLVNGYSSKDDEFFPGVVADNEVYKYNLQFEWAGGGYVMNALDLALTGKLIYENKLFNKSLMQDFLKGIDAKQLGGTWGLGVHIKDLPIGRSYGHSGFFPGYVTNMLYFPEYQFSIAFQVNTSDGKQLGLYRKLFKLIPTIANFLSK